MTGLPVIRFEDGTRIEMQPDLSWSGTPSLLAKAASLLSVGYEYSPSHGAYGYWLADQIVGKIGGVVEVPIVKTEDAPSKDIVF